MTFRSAARALRHLDDHADAAALLVGDLLVREVDTASSSSSERSLSRAVMWSSWPRPVHLVVEVAEEVDVRGMEDVDEDAHALRRLIGGRRRSPAAARRPARRRPSGAGRTCPRYETREQEREHERVAAFVLLVGAGDQVRDVVGERLEHAVRVAGTP